MLGIIGTVWSKMREGLRSRTINKDGVEGEGKKDDENVTNEIKLKCNRGKELGSDDGSLNAILVPQVRVEEEATACEAAGIGKSDGCSVPVGDVRASGEHINAKDCNGEQVNGIRVNNCEGEQVDGVRANSCNGEQVDGVGDDNGNVDQADNIHSKGSRGRKRKNTQVSSKAQRLEMIDLNEPPVVHLTGRVLRSRTVADGLVEEDVKDVDEETDDEVDKNIKLENVEDKSAQPSIGRVLRSRNVADDLVIWDLNEMNEETDEGVVKVDQKELKLENVEDKSAESSVGRVLRSRIVADDLVIGELTGVNEETDGGVDEVYKKSKLDNVKDKSVGSSIVRVLRSRTANDDLVKWDLNDVDEDTDEGSVEVDKKELKLENVEDKSAGPSTGRVLRSRTVAVCATNLVKRDLHDVDEDTDEGVVEVDKKKLKLENVEDKRAGSSTGRVLRSRTVAVCANNSVKRDLHDVDEDTDDGVVEVDKKELKLENVEDTRAGPSIGRVLRSRLVAGCANNLVEGDLNEEIYKDVIKKKSKLENVEDRSAEPSIRGKKKKIKGRRGRPPKVNVGNDYAVCANDLVEGDLNEETDGGVIKKKSKVENVEDRSAEPSIRGKQKKIKGRRGRPPKVNVGNHYAVCANNLVERDLNDLNEETEAKKIKGRRGRPPKVNVENAYAVCANNLVEGDLNEEADEKKIKGRRGRPPKVNVENEYAVCANNLVEGDLNEETAEGVIKKKSKLENVEDRSAEPSIRGKKKKIKGRRGRPPKVNVENDYAVVVVGKKDKVLGSKVSLKSNASIRNLKGESGVNEKKDIRNKLVDMIVRCGWEIQFVPRASKDYNDPVYVNPEGKTHWSITKAYKDLKERIDNGKANTVERAGFTLIPDETLSKLFRVITKKRSDCGIKRSEVVEEKGLVRYRASSKKTDELHSCGQKRKSVPLEGRKKRRFALLARGSRNRSDRDDDESELYNKKRNLLSWMIDLRTVPEGSDVQYRDPIEGATLLEGKVTRDGLSCNCCDEIHTILGFQLHAGSKSVEPLKNLYLRSGLSLFECMVNSWSQQVELSRIGFCSVDVAVDDDNDDTCNMCGDGGDLMCCDFCPSTFHLSCLDVEDVPAGDWHCMYCICKFCGSVGDEALSQDDGHQLIICQLCEAKFHSTCTDQTDAKSMNSATASFCGAGCLKIFNRLQELVGLKQEMERGLSWTILCRHDVGNDASLHDYPLKVEGNAKLAVAYSVMDECFLPVVDPRSQSDMIINVIYNCGSNFRRLNYSGFYTFILEKGDEVVSVASIRFHGTRLAEMPFIATRNIYRRQGLSRQLLTVIEKVLTSMDIQKLVIPAVSDVMAMWTGSFGFIPLKEATWQEMKTMGLIAFPGTDMLQKSMLESTGSESEASVHEGEPIAGADPGDEMVNAIVDGQAVDDSEHKDDSGQKGEEEV